jgi:hypothetical protein
MIVRMFEAVSDAELIDVMGEATRDESTAIAQRLAAVAELFVRRSGELADLEWCVADGCDAVAAEISAAQKISHARAVGQVQFACALRHRLPAVAKIFARGTIDFRMFSTIISRTQNVDDAVMAELDEAIARHAEKWMKLSGPKLRDRVDQWAAKFDSAGVRVPPKVNDNRHVDIDPASPGMAGISGYLHAADGAALDQRLDALAATVCENDPRTKEQRRADACGPLARGEATLACQCESQDCPARASRDTAAAAVIHVLAEQATLDGTIDKPGYLPGFGILPAESVRELAETATLKPLTVPTGAAPDPGYRPTAKTAEFTRWRDLTCRWPGCDKPAERCDIDPTKPWPYGPTHPSNNKPYCRCHHLLKTFFGGPGGWTDQQLPDGTIILTAPTGHTYRTEPHGAAMFPALGAAHRRTGHPASTAGARHRPHRHDAAPQANPRPRPPRPHQHRTPRTHRTHRQRRTPTPSLARRHLRTTTLLSLVEFSPHSCRGHRQLM